jgi:hypothetical protein
MLLSYVKENIVFILLELREYKKVERKHPALRTPLYKR